MKKKILLGLMTITALVLLGGCESNKTIVDLNYKFDKANIRLQTGESITVKVKSWKDYEGEQIQIIAKDGTVYLVNSVNCELIKTN